METNGIPIKLSNLRKSFDSQVVLGGIDLEVSNGETLSILGRSGCGKSVLLKLIIGLIKPDSGKIEIEGRDVTNLPVEELNKTRKKIGFLFQYGALYDSLTVEENVAFPLRRHTQMSASERRNRVQQLLSSVKMEEAIKKMPSDISGGMKKRVALARALALNPVIMLLDEPTSGLDPITAGEINDLICELNQNDDTSAIVVTHDLHTAKAVSSRVAMLDDGQIILEGSFDDLQRSDSPLVSQFLKQSFLGDSYV